MKNSLKFLLKTPPLLGLALLVYLLFSIGLTIFFPERGILLFYGLFIFARALGSVRGDYVTASLIALFFVAPFSLAFRVPVVLGLYDPYVSGQYINYLAPTFSVLDIWVALCLLALTVYYWRKISRETLRRVIFLLALALTYIGVTLFLYSQLITAVTLVRLTIYLLMAYGTTHYLKNKVSVERLKLLAFGLFGHLLLQSVIGLAQFQRGVSAGLSWLGESSTVAGLPGSSTVELAGDLYLRAYGTFQHPNIFAGFLILCFLVFIYLGFEHNYGKQFIFFALLTVLLTVLTFSRTAFFIEVVVLIAYSGESVLRQIRGFKLKHFSAIGVSPFFLRFTNFFSGTDIAFSDRIDLLKASLDLIWRNPIGVGPGLYVRSLGGHPIVSKSGQLLLQPVHNIFLLVLAEYGVFVGLTIILAFIGYSIKSIFNKKRKLFAVSVFFSIVVSGSMDHYFFTTQQGLLIFLALLGLMGLPSINSRKLAS